VGRRVHVIRRLTEVGRIVCVVVRMLIEVDRRVYVVARMLIEVDRRVYVVVRMLIEVDRRVVLDSLFFGVKYHIISPPPACLG
jgi:hypothetical protein